MSAPTVNYSDVLTPSIRIRRLRPDESKCGDIALIVDLVGAPAGLGNAVQWLKAGPFREREAKVVVRDAKSGARVTSLNALAAEAAHTEEAH